MLRGVHSRVNIASCGITSGSATATVELRLLMLGIIRDALIAKKTIVEDWSPDLKVTALGASNSASDSLHGHGA